jgi:hypothetical protein
MSSSSEADVNVYGLIPNRGANLAALILFAILWFFQTILGLWYQQWWFGTAFFIACGLETAGYIGRFLSHGDPYDLNYFLLQIICLTLGPAFFMGGVYFLLAKFAMIYGNNISRLKPMWYSYIFISCDLCSIVLQAIGGGMAATALQDDQSTDSGTHVMVAGLAVQVASMSLFIGLCVDFFLRVRKFQKQADPSSRGNVFEEKYAHILENRLFMPFLYAIGICTILIYIRCIYRLIELAEGWDGYLILHERYFLVLEALFVFLAAFVMTVMHPGFIFGRTHIPVKGLHRKNKTADNSKDEKLNTYGERNDNTIATANLA